MTDALRHAEDATVKPRMPGSTVAAEVEGKLLADGSRTLTAIARLSSLGHYAIRELPTARLHTVYLDTPNRVLAEHGIALRVRRHGRRWEMTAKWAGKVRENVHERPELTVPLRGAPQMPFRVEDASLRLHLGAILAGRPVQPVLVTDIRRRRRLVFPPGAPPDARAIAEIALDSVRVEAPGKRERLESYCEVEVEGIDGDASDVARITEALHGVFALQPSNESKYSRGMRVLYGARPGPRADTKLSADEPLETALRKILARQLRALRESDPGARLGEDPEAVHDMRVASRRLRAAVHTFAQALPERTEKILRAELRWLRQSLGAVRDLDVQIQRITATLDGLPTGHRQALQDYAEHLGAERERQRQTMLTALDSKRYERLLLRLERQALTQPRRRPPAAACEPVGVVGHRAVRKALGRLLKRGRAVHDVPPRPEDLHALRIHAKRLRYTLEFVRDLTGKPGRRCVRRLVRLQDLLGTYHDGVVAADAIRRYVTHRGEQLRPADLLSLGTVAGADLQRAEHVRVAFAKTWKRFTRKRGRRDFDALLERLQETASAGEGRGTVTSPNVGRARPGGRWARSPRARQAGQSSGGDR